MERLRPRSPTSGRPKRSVLEPLGSTGAPLRAPYWERGQRGRLSGLSSRQAKARQEQQHRADRIGVPPGMPSNEIRRTGPAPVDAAGKCASRSVSYADRTRHLIGEHRDAPRPIVCHSGAYYRRANGGPARPHLGPSRYGTWNDRPEPGWAREDEQAAGCRADQQPGARSAGRSTRGRTHGSCDRICRRADQEHPQSGQASGGAVEGSMLSACLPAHSRRDDGTGRRPDAEDRAISRPHINPRDGARLCPVQSDIYEGCKRGSGLVAGTLVPVEPLGRHARIGGKPWWALTGSNRRPSRCKRRAPLPNQHIPANGPQIFATLAAFRSVSVPACGTSRTTRTSRVLGTVSPPLTSAVRLYPQRKKSAENRHSPQGCSHVRLGFGANPGTASAPEKWRAL